MAAALEAERLTTGLDGKDTAECWALRMHGNLVQVHVADRHCKQLQRSQQDELTAALPRLGGLQVWADATGTIIRPSEDCRGDKGIQRRSVLPHPLVKDLDHPDKRLFNEDSLYRHLDGPWYIYLARDL